MSCAFAISRLDRLREVLANPEVIHEARALLAEQIGKFTMERVSDEKLYLQTRYVSADGQCD